MAWSALLGLGLLWSVDAEAGRRPHHHHARPRPHVATRPGTVSRPGVRVSVRYSPWVMGYRPAPRAGYIWVGGVWRGSLYVPGHWRPVSPPPRSDYVWVEGHWDDDTYIDGYWRIEEIDGMIWVDGEYTEEDYVEGHWEDPYGRSVAAEALPGDAAVSADGALAVPFGAEEATEVEEEPAPDLHHAPPDRW